MSVAPRPGWYPDPAGTPELYRWWDGGDWTDAISESPRAPSPRLHSPARPEDELERRRPSRLRSAVALLICLALFLSATAGLGLAIFGDGAGVGRTGRAPADAATTPAPGATDLGAVGGFDRTSRVATLGRASMTLPGEPFVPPADPSRVAGLLDVLFAANAPVHPRYDGRHSWAGVVLLGRLSPQVAGGDLESRGRAAVEGLTGVLFAGHPTRRGTVEVSDHAVDGHEGLVLRTQVRYSVAELPSRYDVLTAVVVQLDDGSVVVAVSSVPDDAEPRLVELAAASLDSLTFR